MEYRTFGRTGLRVSLCGLGSGGQSRLGLGTGSTEQQALAVVRRALDLGINYFDTAADYGTEEIVGRALADDRSEVSISSKIHQRAADGTLIDADALRRGLEASLARLRTDIIDVYHLHRVSLVDYPYCREELVPQLLALRDQGKIRSLAISESSGGDPNHDMLQRAAADDCWDAVMIGFNIFNQSPREQIFPLTRAKDIGVQIMASARSYFSDPVQLTDKMERLVAEGTIDPIDARDAFGFLAAFGGSEHLSATSYRFVAYEPGVHTVLVGTGNAVHLEENVEALSAGPLDPDVHDQLVSLFGHLSTAVEAPWRVKREPLGP